MEVFEEYSGQKIRADIEACIFILEINSRKCFWSYDYFATMESPKDKAGLEDFFAAVLHIDDVERFMGDYKKVLQGKCRCSSNSYRIKNLSGNYQEMSIKLWAALEEGSSQQPDYLVGIIGELDSYSNFDPLTFLPNNHSFRRYLAEKVVQGGKWSVIMLGLDDFSNINELFSYSTGNLLLQECARRIQSFLPMDAVLFRLDGDGFGIVMQNSEEEAVKEWYGKLKRSCITEKFCAAENKFLLTISGGACCFPKDGKDFESIYYNAGKALQVSKKSGKNHLVVYSEKLSEQDRHKAALLTALRESVVMGFKGFYMVYQPIVNAKNQSLTGCEALLRWNNPDFPYEQEISPVEFIPVLEENGLMLEMGRWVLETSIRQCAEWCRYKPDFQMNINVSSLQFEVPSFKYLLMDMISEYQVKPANITLELTESGKVKDPLILSKQFDFIRSQGFHIALDDFGTGYSSLEVLRLLSADELKIDRSFLERISYNVADQALLSMLVNLSRNMNMEVCIEGIEDSKMEEHVCRLKPDLLQGFLYSYPLRAKDFEEKYFSGISVEKTRKKADSKPEYSQSLVYASFRPAQSISAQDMIDNAYAGIFQVGMDENFSFLTCNEGYRRMLGYTAQEVEEKFRNHALGFVHPDDTEYVNNEIRRQLGESDTVTIEFRVVRKDGTPIWILGTGNVYRGGNGTTSLVIVIINNDKNKGRQIKREKAEKDRGLRITNRYEMAAEQLGEHFMEYDFESDEEKRGLKRRRIRSLRDAATNLLNKAATEEQIRSVLQNAEAGEHYAFFMIDVDHFKKVNDTYGHFAGDEVLRNMAYRITKRFRQNDIIGRIGGDEFLAFMPYSGDMQEIINKAEVLVDVIHQPMVIHDAPVETTASIGVSCYPEDGRDFYDLYRRADSALYRRKSMDRNGFCLAARFEAPIE